MKLGLILCAALVGCAAPIEERVTTAPPAAFYDPEFLRDIWHAGPDVLRPLFSRFVKTEPGSDAEDAVHQGILIAVKAQYRRHHPNTAFVTSFFVESRPALMQWWYDERETLFEGHPFAVPPGLGVIPAGLLEALRNRGDMPFKGTPIDAEMLARRLRELGYSSD